MKQVSESQLQRALQLDGPSERVSPQLHSRLMHNIEKGPGHAFGRPWKLVAAGGLSLALLVAAVSYLQFNAPVRQAPAVVSIADALQSAPITQLPLKIPEQTLKQELVALNSDAQKVVAGTPLERLLR